MNYEDQKNKQNKLLDIFIKSRINSKNYDDIYTKILKKEKINNSNLYRIYNDTYSAFLICIEFVIACDDKQYNHLIIFIVKYLINNYNLSNYDPINLINDLGKNICKSLKSDNIYDFFNKFNTINVKSHIIKGLILSSLVNNDEIKVNLYINSNVPLLSILNSFNKDVDQKDIYITFSIDKFNPFKEINYINNCYGFINYDTNKIKNNKIFNEINLFNKIFRKKDKFITRNGFRGNYLKTILKQQIIYSLDTIIGQKINEPVIFCNINDNEILGIVRYCFLPIAAYCKFIRKYNIFSDDEDLLDFICSNIYNTTYKQFLELYLYIPLEDDFFNNYLGDKSVFEKKDSNNFLNLKNLDDVLIHLLNLNQNSETIKKIANNIHNLYDEIITCLEDDKYKEHILEKLYSRSSLISFFTEIFIYYPDTFGKEIFN